MLDLRIGGVHPDIMVLLPIVAGIIGGPARGPSMGFGAGLVADLFLPTPFGLSALVGCLIGFAVGWSRRWPSTARPWWLPPVAAFGASAVYEVIYAVLGSVLGQPQMLHVDLTRIVVVVSVANAVLALPALRLVAWALPAASTEGMPTSDASSSGSRPVSPSGRAAYRNAGAGLGILVPREPLPPPSLQGLAPLPPAPQRDRGPPGARAPPAPDAPEPLLDGGDAGRPGHHRRPARPPPAHRGLVVAACSPCSACACGPSGAPGPGRGPGGGGQPDPSGARSIPTRGLILDRNGNPLVGNQVVEQITLSRVAAQQHPQVIGRLAALIGQTTAQVAGHHRRPPVQPLQAGARPDRRPAGRHPLHQGAPGRVPRGVLGPTTERTYPQGELPGPAQGAYPASQVLGYVGTINTAELKSRASQGYQAGDAFGQSGLEYQYETELRGTPGTRSSRSTPRARWPAPSRPPRP